MANDYRYTITERGIVSQNCQIGPQVFGEYVLADIQQASSTFQYATAVGKYTCAWGLGIFGKIGYSRPVKYTARRVNPPGSVGFPAIDILSTTGALIGRIRSDVEKTIITSLEFTLVNGDCRDFTLELNALPDFPLAPFSIIKVNIGDSSFGWYCGKITSQQSKGARNGETFVFRGEGFSITDLTNLVMDTDVQFQGPQDVGSIVNTIAETQIDPFCSVNYNPSKIDTNTGVLTFNDIQPGQSKIPKFLDTLAEMGNCEWGVDGDGDFFFLPVETNVVKTYFIGYQLNEFTPQLNLKDVKNTIFLQRQNGVGSGGVGYVVDAILSDNTSIAKYGKKELKKQFPGFFSSTDMQTVGNQLLSDLKEPKNSASASGLQVSGEDDFVRRGIHRFILPFDTFPETYSEVEDAAEWDIFTNSGATVTVEDDATLFVFGASSVKASFENANGSRIELRNNFRGKIQNLRVWVRSSRATNEFTLGCGLTNWNENTKPISFNNAQAFFNFDWDLSSENLDRIGVVGLGCNTDTATDIWIDKIEFVIKGFPYYKLKSSKQTYKFSPGENDVQMQFDRIPSKMEDYINNILALAEENAFVAEVR